MFPVTVFCSIILKFNFVWVQEVPILVKNNAELASVDTIKRTKIATADGNIPTSHEYFWKIDLRLKCIAMPLITLVIYINHQQT